MSAPGNATELVWLSPTAGALVALAQPPSAATWETVRADPGCVLLLARHLRSERCAFDVFEIALADADVLKAASNLLNEPAFADFSNPALARVHQVCVRQARLAHLLARRTGVCPAELAWIGGLLAPLGWLAMAALDPARVAGCLSRLRAGLPANDVQRELWGLDQAAIARRLSAAWRLPAWLGAICGSLALPVDIARDVGAVESLFAIVQLAVALSERHGEGLGIAAGETAAALLRRHGLTPEFAAEAVHEAAAIAPVAGKPPASMPLLPDILRIAVNSRVTAERHAAAAAQASIDALYTALEKQAESQRQRLHELKLRGLAELSAGAGHEINNPLAVISGQAQYLMNRDDDPVRRKSLQVIIDQARRIHTLLVELMQFARPPAPHKVALPVASLLRDVRDALASLIEEKKIDWRWPEPPVGLYINADPVQIQAALKNVVRNALEAAPSGGWVSLTVAAADGRVEFVVEDSGAGLSAAAREHLFDPFYSGKSAGRGRGLGLATAWRFATQNDGALRYVEQDGPTRFVLEVPAAAPCELPINGHAVTAPHPAAALSWD